jgi:hypothetical protein
LSGGDDHAKGEILRKALTLYVVAREARIRGQRVGTVDANGILDTEFIGIDSTTSLKLSIPDAVFERLERIAEEKQISLGEIFRRALQLFDVAHHSVREGKKVGIFDASGRLEREFIGL